MTPEQFSTDGARWQAIRDNDPRADDAFYYAVMTTGVYCRPSCRSKLPNRCNVEYFATSGDAEAAGYRACRRCRPTATAKVDEREQKIIEACRIIEESETSITLGDLAMQVKMSPYHFHRLFKKVVGVTPKQYASRVQSRRFQNKLKTSPSVTEAIYAAGYGSSGSVYDRKRDQLAMKPKIYRRGADGVNIIYGVARCFLGWVIVAATDRGICAIEFGDDPESLPDLVRTRFPNAQVDKADSGFKSLVEEVVAFIESPQDAFHLPLDIQGTAFQQQVWNVLRQIKPGRTMSYTEVADRIGKAGAPRAAASACAANKLAVVIPCHRVISKAGKAGGYRWGTERKKRLLQMEQDQTRQKPKS